jgi:hypothetical protein
LGLLADTAGYVQDPASLTPARGLLSLAGALPGIPAFVARPKGWEAAGDAVAKMSKEGHLYRGMTKDEFLATIAKKKGVKSRGDYSFADEGTSFSDRFDDAESYVNFGRTDPRKTGNPNYIVEVLAGPGFQKAKDGYWKTQDVSQSDITRIWEMVDLDGEVVARQIR